MTVDELIEEFGVTREQVHAVLAFAAHTAEAEAGVSNPLRRNGADFVVAK